MNISRSFFVASASAVVALFSISTAYAIPVTYSTVGLIDGAASKTVGDSTLTFENQVSTTANPIFNYPSFTNIPLGTFVVDSTALNPDDFNGTAFSLQIFQTSPTGGNVGFVGQIDGFLTAIGSTLTLEFTAPLTRFIVGGGFATVYRVDPTYIIANTSDGKRTTIQGQLAVTDNPGDIPGIPEPASMVLFGLGGIGLLGGAVRRRRAEKAAA